MKPTPPNLSIAIIQMGLPPEPIRTQLGDQADWFAAALGKQRSQLLIAQPFQGEALPTPSQFGLAIVTGSWSMVTDREAWSERTAAWLRQLIQLGKPVLGICYGHQLMAHAMGGRVDDLPGGRESGPMDVQLTAAAAQDPLLAQLPRTFTAFLSHTQSVLEPPPSAQILGGTARDPYQVLRYGPAAFSVQFHPEFTPGTMAACDSGGRTLLPAAQQGTVLPEAVRILHRFVTRHQERANQTAATATISVTRS